MWELDCEESWALRNWQQLWCWRRFLRVPWTARRSNQSILKEISPGCSLEEVMLKLKHLWPPLCEELTHWKRLWFWAGLGAGGEGDEAEMAGWHHHLDGHEFEQALGVGEGQGSLVCCSPWGPKELDTNEQLNWTELWIKRGLILSLQSGWRLFLLLT